jgi:hypothetical protein
MSYKSGCCCSGGLGQTSQEVDSARRILVGMISRESGRIEGLPATPAVSAIRAKIADASRWSKASFLDWEAGRMKDALDRATVGIRTMHEVSAAITRLTPEDVRASEAQRQTQTGASFGDQVLATLGIKTGVYQPAVPGSSVADVVGGAVGGAARAAEDAFGSPWILPAALAGAVLFFAMRK